MSGITVPSTPVDLSQVWTQATRSLTAQALGELTDAIGHFSIVTSAVQNTLGSYVQIVASTAHTVRAIQIVIGGMTASENYVVDIATGGAGSEVVKVQTVVNVGATPVPVSIWVPVDETLIPKGVRVAVAAANSSSANARTLTVSAALQMKAD